MKRILPLVAAALIGGGMFAATTTSAQAVGCFYRLKQDGVGILQGSAAIRGVGHAAKYKTACKRAERRCNRRFQRARKNGWLPRGGPRDFRCVRMAS